VPVAVRKRIAETSEAIVQGRIRVPETFDGAEFATPA